MKRISQIVADWFPGLFRQAEARTAVIDLLTHLGTLRARDLRLLLRDRGLRFGLAGFYQFMAKLEDDDVVTPLDNRVWRSGVRITYRCYRLGERAE